MIGYIKGKVLHSEAGVVLLENNGIGYEIVCSGALFAKLITEGQGEAYTYLQVREDGVSLFGFVSIEEKNMFLKLISVSGVGPKMGIAILAGMNLGELAVAIASSDVKLLRSRAACERGRKTCCGGFGETFRSGGGRDRRADVAGLYAQRERACGQRRDREGRRFDGNDHHDRIEKYVIFVFKMRRDVQEIKQVNRVTDLTQGRKVFAER